MARSERRERARGERRAGGGDSAALPVATFSIAAFDPAARRWGVAVASKFLGVGSIVPWAEAGAGAVATQSYANPRYGPEGLALLRAGGAAAEVVAQLVAADPDREQRQVGVVDATGGAASFTGARCHGWAGHRTGSGFAAQGNLLAGARVVDALAAAFTAGGAGGRPLAERLLACLAAAEAAGGDRRGRQSAALLVVEAEGGYAGLWDRLVDLRVDDHRDPLAELARLYCSHDRLFGTTPAGEWLPVDAALATELAARLAALGHRGPLAEALAAWAGVENLEERVDGAERIDPVVLEALREAG